MSKSTAIRDLYKKFYARVSGYTADFVPTKGAGVFLENHEGKSVLDFTSGYGVSQHGYDPKISKILSAEFTRHLLETNLTCFDFNAWPHEWGVKLAKKLCAISPINDPKIFFCNSGAEANEAALKLFPNYRERPIIFACHKSFHGRTLGSLSLTDGKNIYHEGFPRIPNILHMPFPDKTVDRNMMIKILTEHRAEHISRIILELVQGEGGMRVADKRIVTWIDDFCRDNGILLIIDEVQTGFGRTGKMFACEHYGLHPDAILLGKGIALGLAMGAIIFRSELDWEMAGQHSNTMGGNILTAIAALENLKLFESNGLEKLALERGAKLEELLASLQKDFPKIITDFHGLGLMYGVDIASTELRDMILKNAYKENLLLIGASDKTIRVTPPLIITNTELRLGIQRLRNAIHRV